jgi:hypothetical protein
VSEAGRTERSGRPPWIATLPSSVTLRAWPSPTVALPRAGTSRRRSTAVCDTSCWRRAKTATHCDGCCWVEPPAPPRQSTPSLPGAREAHNPVESLTVLDLVPTTIAQLFRESIRARELLGGPLIVKRQVVPSGQ